MASTIKSNTVTNATASTLTLGESGTTVTLACGATQSGFGRTGTVDWCTTVKTSPLTAVSGNGYFVNTCGGAVTVTLPSSPTAGDIVSLADYKSTWDVACKAVTLGRGGSKINGECDCAKLSTKGQSVTLVYVDGTQGWKSVQDSTADVTGSGFLTATGGTITTVCTDYKVHTFNADGPFTITDGTGYVSYMVVGGGGGSSNDRSGGGAGGGFREGRYNTPDFPDTYSVSPLAATTGVPVSPGSYSISVGAAGAAKTSPPFPDGGQGGNSVFSTITSAGGGGGGKTPGTQAVGAPGGSGGGGGSVSPHTPQPGGTGNTPPVSPPQGNNGGSSGNVAPGYATGGGGGAGAVGTNGGPTCAGDGGAGVTTSISSAAVARAGGGGGGSDGGGSEGSAGSGGGGSGGSPPTAAVAGGRNLGGGAGGTSGGSTGVTGKAGGSGVVIIRYKFQ